ncbi:MAG TPA: hypothetical protein VKA70_21540 [Blastocatellia bacterium]|nr:hypothetical protein [Blastocatellia bacterium]
MNGKGAERLTRPPESGRGGERGTATLTAVMLMAMLALFTAASLSRVTTEAMVMGNDYSNTQSFYAAQASLELMSRNFNDVFNVRLSPNATDILNIKNSKPNIPGFDFVQNIEQTDVSAARLIDEGPFAGLFSLRDPWRLDSVATYGNGAQVQLTRTFYNHRIPIFQFGIFYNDDLEVHPGPPFAFGGRVHSNRHIFMMAGDGGLDFDSRVTAAGEIVYNASRDGRVRGGAGWSWNGRVRVINQSNVLTTVNQGSVTLGPDTNNSDPDMPNGALNNNWDAYSAQFGSNLLARQRRLRLPIQISSNADPIELIKRSRPGDSEIMTSSRFCNKPGIRITLGDSVARLPGGVGGVRLDAPVDGTRGYRPAAMNGGAYQATRFNGHRVFNTASYNGQPRETWIKIELVDLDANNLPVTRDITADFLSMGFTESAGSLGMANDSRAVLKLQRYVIPGPPVKVASGELGGTSLTPTPAISLVRDGRDNVQRDVYTYSAAAGSFVALNRFAGGNWVRSNAAIAQQEEDSHKVTVLVGGTQYQVVPFPIKMYDLREGLYNEDVTNATWGNLFMQGGNFMVPRVGVMSMIDIDMFNLGRFLRGDWNGQFPNNPALPGNSLSSDDVPDNGGDGWIIYISDRRGDRDDDGEYDMEDVFVNADGSGDGVDGAAPQPGEDANHNGRLDIDRVWESRPYTEGLESDIAAVSAPKGGEIAGDRLFRRGVRLINGATLFGSPTRGYTIASENAVYVQGNYNATGIDATAPNQPSPPIKYQGAQVPAAIVSDGVTFLSRQWSDGKSFRSPFVINGTRTVTAAGETTVRTALLMGDNLSFLDVAANRNQGGGDKCLSGGVHNFIRFIESWGTNVNYCGSLINLFNSRNNNGTHKNGGGHTYGPPTRNWVFDSSFLDPDRLPPGTPFFQFVQMTGFRQTVRQVD